jgi:hypothetical protein
MKPHLKWHTVLFTSSMALMLTSCSAGTKVNKCNKIIKIANEAVGAAGEFSVTVSQGGKTPYIQAADKLDSLTASMKRITLSDVRLKGYRTKFVTMYKSVSTGLREATMTRDANVMNQHMRNIRVATAGEDKLVKEMNAYCAK